MMDSSNAFGTFEDRPNARFHARVAVHKAEYAKYTREAEDKRNRNEAIKARYNDPRRNDPAFRKLINRAENFEATREAQRHNKEYNAWIAKYKPRSITYYDYRDWLESNYNAKHSKEANAKRQARQEHKVRAKSAPVERARARFGGVGFDTKLIDRYFGNKNASAAAKESEQQRITGRRQKVAAARIETGGVGPRLVIPSTVNPKPLPLPFAARFPGSFIAVFAISMAKMAIDNYLETKKPTSRDSADIIKTVQQLDDVSLQTTSGKGTIMKEFAASFYNLAQAHPKIASAALAGTSAAGVVAAMLSYYNRSPPTKTSPTLRKASPRSRIVASSKVAEEIPVAAVAKVVAEEIPVAAVAKVVENLTRG